MSYLYSEKDRNKIERARQDEKIMGAYGISYCLIEDAQYPSVMRELKGMPPLLYYKGNIEILNQQKSVAVIGSRKMSEEAIKLAYSTGTVVAEKGLNLVNGLALGCDTQALRGALDAGGRCVAILPCGLEQVQPKSNQWLADKILDKGGCLISEYPIGTSVQKHQYVERDRLQSGVSQGVLIIEAEINSGTMHTARFASAQARRLACYYHALLGLSSGNKYLEETEKAQALKTKGDLEDFLDGIQKIKSYEQLTFDFSCDNQMNN